MPERVLALALHGAQAHGTDQLLQGQLVQCDLDLCELPTTHLGERSRPEDLAEDCGVLEEALALRRERVEASCDERLHSLRQRELACSQASVGEQTDELLRIERVAARVFEYCSLQLPVD